MKRYLSLLLAAFVFLSGCAVKDGGAPTVQQVEAKRDQLAELSSSKTVSIAEHPYLGAKPIVRQTDGEDIPVLNASVTLKQKGTLSEIAASLSTIAPLSAQVSDTDADDPQPTKQGSASPELPALDDLGLPPLASMSGLIDVSYTGSLRGLLDTISSLSGYGWDYDAKTNRITFSAMQVRTYTIMAAPGVITYDSQVSNKSKERTSGSSISGSSINSTVSSGDTSSQTSQVHTSKIEMDIWKEIETAVKGLLSKRGTVSINQAAGTVTVRDNYTRLRDVTAYINSIKPAYPRLRALPPYIDSINARLSRQVAITVRVWALELTDASSAGLNLQALFENNDVSVVAGSLGDLGSASTAAVSVVKGKLKGSSGTIKALKEWGRATQLSSAGGLLMSNQPLPVRAIKRHAYLAGMTLATSEYNQTSEITPGEVTTGFAMTIIPHILPDRRVILQYMVTLSALDSMEEIDREQVYVQLPQVSTRSFAQRSKMKMGQTLVLAGFEQSTQNLGNSLGVLNTSRDANFSKTLLVVTIELESAENV